MSKSKKGSWIVTVRCAVIKEVVVENCTAEEAREHPFLYSVSQRELEQSDCCVDSVEPNV
jgi:hypothetical protein